MQNILDHIQYEIFVLTVEPDTNLLDINNYPESRFILRFAIANLAFVQLIFGENSINANNANNANNKNANLIGLQPHECLPLEFAYLLNVHISQCLQSRQRVEYEAKLDLATHRLLSISLSPNFDHHTHTQQIVGTCQDITNLPISKSQVRYFNIQTDIIEQIKSTQRLLESEERLRTVLTSIKEGITFSDDTGYFAIFNSGMENLTGYSIAEANSSQDFTSFLYPDRAERDKALQRLQYLQETGRVTTIETRIRHKDETFKDVLVSTRLMIYKGKRMYLSSYYDITDRKKIETQLRYQNERERLLNAILLKIQCQLNLDQILAITVKETQELLRIDRVVIYQFQEDWSGTFVVQAINDESLSILGKTINDSYFNQDYTFQSQNKLVSSINDIDLAELSACHKQLLQCFQVKANIVVAISFGDKLWGLLIAHQCFAPRHWEDFEIDLLRQLASHVAIAIQQVELFDRVQELNKNLERQVADRTQELEQSLRQLERALLKEKELNELKSQFISRASHEFRTPLATIQTASDLLRNYGHKMSDDKKLERIDKIQREVKGMTSLLEEVLIIGKSESGKFDLQLDEINLEDFCWKMLEQSKLLGSGKHQIIFKNINAPLKIEINIKFFKQIIANLLSNAIKYSPNGGEITFTISQTSDRIPKLLLEICDQGIGIPVAHQEKIFEHFYRAPNVGMIAGTGLGMAIIKNSIDILRGTIQLNSVENKGTNIQVKLPLVTCSDA